MRTSPAAIIPKNTGKTARATVNIEPPERECILHCRIANADFRWRESSLLQFVDVTFFQRICYRGITFRYMEGLSMRNMPNGNVRHYKIVIIVFRLGAIDPQPSILPGSVNRETVPAKMCDSGGNALLSNEIFPASLPCLRASIWEIFQRGTECESVICLKQFPRCCGLFWYRICYS